MINKVFVYGTLKVGHGNHQYFCSGAKKIINGKAIGELYDLGFFPQAKIADENIIVPGSTDITNDISLRNEDSIELKDLTGDNGISGEIMIFEENEDETVARMRSLDSLEGFRGDNSFYERVLVQVKDSEGLNHVCWTYRCPNGKIPHGNYIKNGVWE